MSGDGWCFVPVSILLLCDACLIPLRPLSDKWPVQYLGFQFPVSSFKFPAQAKHGASETGN
jgi:hypothetical protein